MNKTRWISVKVSQRIAEIVKTTASTMGISVSEFTRQAILERLEGMNLIGSEIKSVLARGAEELECQGSDSPVA